MDTAHRIDVRRKAVRNCLAALLAIASFSLIAAGHPPQTTIVSTDATFTNDFDCSFPLQEQVKGAYRDTLYFDGNGTLTKEFLVGRIVIERGQGVTFEVGPHQEFDGDTAAFCAYLAQ